MKFSTLVLVLFAFCQVAFAQKDQKVKKDPFTSTSLWEPIPINRQLSHDKIDRLQKSADEFDEKLDGKIILINNKKSSESLTESIIKKVDQLQLVIENLPLDHWGKVKYLMYLETDVKQYYDDMVSSKVNPIYYENLINNFEVIFKKQLNNEPIVDYINSNFTRSIYGSVHMFKEDRDALEAVYHNMVRLYPDEMMSKFYEFSDKEAAVTLMTVIAPMKPNLILTYATSTSFEKKIVRKSTDSLVKTIVDIADNAKRPLRAIVFLEDLKAGRKSLAEVNLITADNATYFRSLVTQRLIPNNVSKKILERELKEQALEYVRTMNELHDAQDPVRFKCIEPLTAKEIYYLLVMCSDEIYTSTFVGAFNRMMTKMSPLQGDVFLKELEMDKFRTFIRMCAGYNKLSQFLAAIEEGNRNTLMATFVHDIDKNVETDLEDAVDVADAIGSINDDVLVDYLLAELKKDYERTYLENDKRGLTIYFLLHTLTVSIINPDQTSDDLQNELKIPPIATIPNKNVLNDSGRVVEQVFFYGDEDGKSSYNSFLSNYKPDDWKTEKNDKWVTLTSIKGKPITVYANLPLDEPADEEAQRLLVKHLEQNNIRPSIVIHRGHSYHLSGTLKYLNQDNKIIILGSCGGYHNLSTILGSSEDAHIISSKQTGTMLVTDPIIKAVQERLLAGKDINWIEIWTELGLLMKTPALMDKFNDYVPPHKNMGALFLKAFKIQMQENKLM